MALFADQVVALSRKVEAMNAALSRLERRVESLAAVAPSAAAVSPALQVRVRQHRACLLSALKAYLSYCASNKWDFSLSSTNDHP